MPEPPIPRVGRLEVLNDHKDCATHQAARLPLNDAKRLPPLSCSPSDQSPVLRISPSQKPSLEKKGGREIQPYCPAAQQAQSFPQPHRPPAAPQKLGEAAASEPSPRHPQKVSYRRARTPTSKSVTNTDAVMPPQGWLPSLGGRMLRSASSHGLGDQMASILLIPNPGHAV